MWFTVLVLSQLTPQARYELARTCTGHDLLLLLLPTTMPHMLGVQAVSGISRPVKWQGLCARIGDDPRGRALTFFVTRSQAVFCLRKPALPSAAR